MARTSINFATVNGSCFAHNDRTQEVSYLVRSSDNNFCSTSSDSVKKEYNLLREKARKAYIKTVGRRPQANTKYLKEAVVVINKHTTPQRIEELGKELEKRTGMKLLQYSIHRDEGKNENELNEHAHLTFFEKDLETGKSIWRTFTKKQLREFQDITAKVLKMERGRSVKETGAKHLTPKEFRRRAKEQEEILAKQKDLQEEVKTLRAELKEGGAKRTDYAELEELNKNLKAEIKEKNLTIEDMKDKLDSISFKRTNIRACKVDDIIEYASEDKIFGKKINEELLRETLKIEYKKIEALRQKVNSQPNYNELIRRNEELEEENKKLKKDLLEKNDLVEKLENIVNKLKTKLKVAELKLKGSLGLNEKYKDEIIGLEEQIKGYKSKISDLSNKNYKEKKLNDTEQDLELSTLAKELRNKLTPEEDKLFLETLKKRGLTNPLTNEDISSVKENLQNNSKKSYRSNRTR